MEDLTFSQLNRSENENKKSLQKIVFPKKSSCFNRLWFQEQNSSNDRSMVENNESRFEDRSPPLDKPSVCSSEKKNRSIEKEKTFF